jgi:succinate dehydrogenase / fumarate reductase, cytochrome b subunit
MSMLKTTLAGYVRYRGHEGHWVYLLHRLAGLGTLLFLGIHILTMSMASISPPLFIKLMAMYRSTFFGIAEIFLVLLVIYHGTNGLRIAILDLFATRSWTIPIQRASTRWTLITALILWLPAAVILARNLLINNFGLAGG